MQAALGLHYITRRSVRSSPVCSRGRLNVNCLLQLQLHWFAGDLYIAVQSDQTSPANWMLPCRSISASWGGTVWVVADVTFPPWAQTSSWEGSLSDRGSLQVGTVKVSPKSRACTSRSSFHWTWSHSFLLPARQEQGSQGALQVCSALAGAALTPVVSVM